MSYLLNIEQKMNDIIFSNRNKDYGAYEIRSSYGETIMKSLGIMLSGFASISALAFYVTRTEPAALVIDPPFIRDSVFVVPFHAPEDKPAEPLKKSGSTTPPANEDLTNNSKNLVIDSNLVAEKTSTQTIVETSTAIAIPVEGSGTGTSTNSIANNNTSKGGIIGEKTVKHQYEVDEMPEFPGGLKALNDYLRKNTHYPAGAVDDNVQGLLYVKFIVDEEGYVKSAELLNSVRGDLNNEALRVVGSIPRFKSPGKAKGEPVQTYYQVPINFKLH